MATATTFPQYNLPERRAADCLLNGHAGSGFPSKSVRSEGRSLTSSQMISQSVSAVVLSRKRPNLENTSTVII
ncbi:hypothetical protein Pcinc_013506 [Petrolisthes cinctipes]|uniref:Uncharacterized protein n=1 Tax=Petrolisthes cinctipes TaxID=88211 RepID=A0AAE1KRJ7_PETCI|nr:hypothetical protein Pcinc_013506 [Petrolisthes cinctipes]